jgi:NADH-quinone oxidoreductase subunit H
LTSALKNIVVLGFGVVIFFPMTLGDNIFVNILWFAFKCFVLMLVSCTFVKSATGRFRIEQAFGFYLKIPALLAAISLILVWFEY